MSDPYRVVLDATGCPECREGRTWTVIGPDNVAVGESWPDIDMAETLADYLNMAYEAGKASTASSAG